MTSKVATVQQYLDELPDDRRAAIETVRNEILKSLPKGYEEGMQYGMIGYFVPHSIYPNGYHCDKTQPLPFAHVASQKNHMAVYMFCMYGDPEMRAQFIKEYEATGKKIDMGGSCLRFKKIENLPVELIGKYISQIPVDAFIAKYESALTESRKSRKK